MDPTLAQLIQWLLAYGPWLLFALAVLETSFVTGLVVPSGVATSAATVLALQGQVALAPFVAAALAGGAVGDSVGFFVGRAWGARVLRGDGAWARLVRRHEEVMRFFGRHPVYSVPVARLVSFVRTLMPMAAGMSGLSYRRYLPFELVGLVGWALLYVTIGFAARESWLLATRLVGWGGTVIFVAIALVALRLVRRRRPAAREAEDRQTAPEPVGKAGEPDADGDDPAARASDEAAARAAPAGQAGADEAREEPSAAPAPRPGSGT